MNASNVLNIYRKLTGLGIEVWIDGGWGVDALLGKQTRLHQDFDIVLQQKDLPMLRELLSAEGYKDVERDDTRRWNFVLGDNNGNEIDIHAIVIDKDGNGLYGPEEMGVMFPAGSLTGTGTIAGQAVRCISAEHMVQFHTGYEIKDNDIADVTALCERFGIPFSEEYRHLKKAS